MAESRRRFLLAACLFALPVWAQTPAPRVKVEDQWFDGVARVAGTDLLLNGTGVRAVAWFKGYAAGLYLRARATSAEQALAMAGPKRLQLRMLYDVPAAEFVKAVHKGVLRNATAQQAAALAAGLAQFERQVSELSRVRRGDVIDLDYEPGRGMSLRLNGTLRGGLIAGDDFFTAVLRSFVGERPYDERLKAGLLGGPA